MLAALLLQNSQSLPWVALALLGLCAVTLLTYPAQLRHMPRAISWVPLALRLLAMMAVGLSILRPVMTRARAAAERPPVVVLLDDSASMSVVDFNRPAAEWVGIAAAMGRLPPDARNRHLDTVQSDCDQLSGEADAVLRARAELDYAKLADREIEPAQTRLDQSIQALQRTAQDATRASAGMRDPLLDRTLAYLSRIPAGVETGSWLDRIGDRARNAATAAEQARLASDGSLFRSDARVRQACHPLQILSRWQLCALAVTDPVAGLLARLEAGAPVLGFAISDHVIPMDLRARHLDSLAADRPVSNLTGEIRALVELVKNDPPRAIVLFSDGRLNGAEMTPATLTMLQGVPIFTVGAAARAGLRDLSILSAIAPSRARVGESITITAELRSFGMRGVNGTVTVTGGGEPETRSILLPDDRPVAVSFTRAFSHPGLQMLKLTLSPVPGELTDRNNQILRWVNVSAASSKSTAATRPATQPAEEDEMADLNGDEGFLRRLSESSGGEFFRLDQLDLLPKSLSRLHDDNDARPIEIPLWDSPFLYALVLGCLTAEWGIRKKIGLS